MDQPSWKRVKVVGVEPLIGVSVTLTTVFAVVVGIGWEDLWLRDDIEDLDDLFNVFEEI